jgi:hypothetical protein
MPYKVSGNKVLVNKGGKWITKQTCKSHAAAEAAVRLLRGIKHGMKPREQKK